MQGGAGAHRGRSEGTGQGGNITLSSFQVDEPALREGLPLKVSRHAAYLRWAVDAFRCTTAVAAPETQV